MNAAAAAYLRSFDQTWTPNDAISAVRFVVLDTETMGLNPKRDPIISIGAIAVGDSQIVLEDSIELLLRIPYNGASVTVHGITRDEAARRQFDIELQNVVIDTMDLALDLRETGWSPPGGLDGFSLDELCRVFSVAPHDRHTAGGDAFLTAQIFLRLLRVAQQQQRTTLRDISAGTGESRRAQAVSEARGGHP